MEKWESFEDAKKRIEKADARKTVKPLTNKEVEKQIRSGKLTEEQAIGLCQRYTDNQKYKEDQQFVVVCGGIKPLPILPPPDEEE